MSMPLSHFIPAYPSPSPCPQVCSLCLYSCCVHLEGWDREGGRETQEGGDIGIYGYVELIHFVVKQKLTHHCEAIILHKDVKKKKRPLCFWSSYFQIKLCGLQKSMVSMNYPEPDEIMKTDQLINTSLNHI